MEHNSRQIRTEIGVFLILTLILSTASMLPIITSKNPECAGWTVCAPADVEPRRFRSDHDPPVSPSAGFVGLEIWEAALPADRIHAAAAVWIGGIWVSMAISLGGRWTDQPALARYAYWYRPPCWF